MKFSLQYLNGNYFEKPVAPSKFKDLIHRGFEYSYEKILPNIVIADIVEVSKHPNADRLSICKVVYKRKLYQIICGAPNVRPGIKVAVALPGTTLPNQLKIVERELRGVISQGMICSADELDLGFSSEGILVVEGVSTLTDSIIDIDIYPNRGDCLSYQGMSNEFQLFDSISLKKNRSLPQLKKTNDIKIQSNPALCDRFSIMRIDNIDLPIESPLWLKLLLSRSGIRPISPLVDITNLVMIEYGQPLHAYDAGQVGSKFMVRYARDNEKIIALDSSQYTLCKKDIVIADGKSILSLAGIIGGLQSSIKSTTRTVYIESAWFDSAHISLTSQRLNLRSEASTRFAIGFNRTNGIPALQRTLQLVKEISKNANKIKASLSTFGNDRIKSKKIIVNLKHSSNKLGFTITKKTAIKELLRINCDTRSQKNKPSNLVVTPPIYRNDINLPCDIEEELARLIGYDKIQHSTSKPLNSLISDNHKQGKAPTSSSHIKRYTVLRQRLISLGFAEAIHYSFVKKNSVNLGRQIKILNPISKELAYLRTSLLPSFIETATSNLNRDCDAIKMYEIGNCYSKTNASYHEKQTLAALTLENHNSRGITSHWHHTSSEYDFFSIKGELDLLFNSKFQYKKIQKESEWSKLFHTGRSAEVFYNSASIGFMGQLHPNIFEDFDKPIFYFEISISEDMFSHSFSFKEPSPHQMSKRDISFWINKGSEYQKVSELLEEICVEYDILAKYNLFDLYTTKDQDIKSLAISLFFISQAGNITSKQIDLCMKTVIYRLKSRLGITLRDGDTN